MTLPAALAGHDHISEREADGTWEDCTWDSGLEWFRLTQDGLKIPATHAEAQRLRAASGEPPTGGSNLGNLKDGILARYGRGTPPLQANDAALTMRPGEAAVVQGSMSAFGPGHPLSTYDRNFDGTHATFIAKIDTQPRWWWCDPEAPDTGYMGQWISEADLRKFIAAFPPGQTIIAPLDAVQKGDSTVTPIYTYAPGSVATIKGESNIRLEPRIAATKARMVPKGATERQTIIGSVVGDKDPKNGSTSWLMWWNPDTKQYEYTAADNIASLVAPAQTDCKVQVAEAVAAQKVADAGLTIAAIDKAKTEATKAERERLAQVAADNVRNS